MENRQLPASFLIQNSILGLEPRSSWFGAMLGGSQGWWLRPSSPKQPQAFP